MFKLQTSKFTYSKLSCKEVLYVLVQPRPRSTIMDDLLDAIELTATGRRLQSRRLAASAPFWGCDDTLFECKSVSKMAPTGSALDRAWPPSMLLSSYSPQETR